MNTPDLRGRRILLAHGDGGELTHELIQCLFQKYFNAPELIALTDAALLLANEGKVIVFVAWAACFWKHPLVESALSICSPETPLPRIC